MTLLDPIDLDTKFDRTEGRVLLSGIQALVRLPLEQRRLDQARGLNTGVLISGYEGSPLGGYDLALARLGARLAAERIVHVPAVNEELGATAIWGSQLLPGRPNVDGVVGIWYGKAPGLDRAGDAIKHGTMQGSSRHGGVLVLVGDDPASKSSSMPSASELAFVDYQLPVLYPGTTQEVLAFGLHGVALSRYCGFWTGVKIVTDVADGFGTVEVGGVGAAPVEIEPHFEYEGKPWRHEQVTGAFWANTAEVHSFYGRYEAAKAYAALSDLNQITLSGPADRFGIVAAGKTYYDVRDALRSLGLSDRELGDMGVRLLRIGMLHPLEEGIVRRFADGLDEILVIEEKRPLLETALRDLLYDQARRPRVVGKRDPEGARLVPGDGELTADRLAPALAARLAVFVGAERLDLRSLHAPAATAAVPLELGTHRTPYFCSGCPHNLSTVAPEGSLTGAGIGCHGMVAFTPTRKAHMTQMGGEGSQWIGQAPFVDVEHMFQNVGDGTFFHSGSLGVRACVAAGVNITFKILYNSAVAMTGGQESAGALPVPDLTRLLEAEGVVRTIVCADDTGKYPAPAKARFAAGVDVWDRSRLDEAQRLLAATPGVTALIYDQRCAAEARRLRKRGKLPTPPLRVVINEDVCEGCGDCGAKSNCLSVQPVESELGTKTRIDQGSCNKDYSCLQGDCPSFVTLTAPSKPVKPGKWAAPARAVPKVDLPEPPAPSLDDEYGIYLTGVGGTGVVTVNQLLATAAAIDGLTVAGVDQTGLSQKAGPVMSHLKLQRRPHDGAARIGAAAADCFLAFDSLTALEAKQLAHASPDRTVAVVSTSPTPTSEMILDNRLALPSDDSMRAAIDAATRGPNVYVDAVAVAKQTLGDPVAANTLLVGVAYQCGLLPLSAAAIRRAIELNGAAVEINLAAFTWGRIAVHRPDLLDGGEAAPRGGGPARASRQEKRAARLVEDAGLTGEVGRLAQFRAAELSAYQDDDLARGYVELVGQAAEAERAAGVAGTDFAEAVACNLYKLAAYKDEYEVARLFLKPDFAAGVRAAVPEGTKLTYHLHPPVLRSLGMKQKMTFGPWFKVVFRGLHAARRLRGTPFDPFGRAKVRRVERGLVEEYRGLVQQLCQTLTADSHERAVALASAPDLVRGYEEIKLANVERYRARLAELAMWSEDHP